jgi:hypothetical protein
LRTEVPTPTRSHKMGVPHDGSKNNMVPQVGGNGTGDDTEVPQVGGNGTGDDTEREPTRGDGDGGGDKTGTEPE